MPRLLDIKLKRGALEICVLELLSQGERNGHQLATSLSDALGLSESDVYRLVRRLYASGYIEACEAGQPASQPRKLYRLTSHGCDALKGQRKSWRRFSKAVDTILVRGKSDHSRT